MVYLTQHASAKRSTLRSSQFRQSGWAWVPTAGNATLKEEYTRLKPVPSKRLGMGPGGRERQAVGRYAPNAAKLFAERRLMKRRNKDES